MQRRLRLGLGRISEEDNSFVPEDAARVGRRAIYLPVDEIRALARRAAAHAADHGCGSYSARQHPTLSHIYPTQCVG